MANLLLGCVRARFKVSSHLDLWPGILGFLVVFFLFKFVSSHTRIEIV